MSDNKHDFAKLFAVLASSSESESHEPKPIPEAIVAELRLRGLNYIESLTSILFTPGQLVTVRKGACIKGDGQPHIVIDTNPNALPNFEGERGSNAYGKRDQVRVLTFSRGSYPAYWMEAAELEPYTLPTDDAPIL